MRIFTKKFLSVGKGLYVRAGLFCLGFALVGLIALQLSHATTFTASSQAEDGTVQTNACKIADASASNTQAVKFSSASGCASNSPLANLPRVPWSGGPAYYAQFSKAAAFGWTDPSFFPIAEWLPCTNDASELGKDMAAGINVSVGLCNGANYSLLRSKGMSVFADGTNVNQGAETIGYFLDDEVDGRMGNGYGATNATYSQCVPDVEPRHCGYTAMAHWNTLYPANSQTMRYANYTGGVSQGDTTAAATFLDTFQDVASVDNYFYSGAGNACYTASVAGLVVQNRCPRAANYGTIVRHLLQDVNAKSGNYHPIWNVVELGRTGSEPGITPPQAVGATWSSIINGSMGVLYFIEGTGDGPCGMPGNILRDTCSESTAVTAAITRSSAQIKSLAPVLNTQSYKWTFNPKLDTMLKYSGGSVYIFSMLNQAADPGSFTYTLPTGLTGSSVQVVDENRSIPITSGTFSDSFAAEYSYHIYKVTL